MMTKTTDENRVRFSLKTKLFLVVLVSFGVLTLAIVLHIRREANRVAVLIHYYPVVDNLVSSDL